MPRVFPAMPITSWPSRTRGIIWGTQCAASIVSHYLERQFGNLSSGHCTALWVFGVGFAPTFVRSTTVVEPRLKRRGMDAHVSKASRSDTGCQVKDCLPHCFDLLGDAK